MSFLVVTHKHGLIPFAKRISADTDILVWRRNYRKVWDGEFVPIQGAEPSTLELEKIVDLIEEQKPVVLSDVRDYEADYPTLEPEGDSVLRMGCWFDMDGEIHEPHMLVYDMGFKEGDRGRRIANGCTMIRLEGDARHMAKSEIEEQHVDGRFIPGFYEVSVEPDEDMELQFTGANRGWNPLQSHAFISHLENFEGLLLGEEPKFSASSKYVCVAPITIPPWPEHGRPAAQVDIEATPEARGQVFWHDVAVGAGERNPMSAGTDGLLGVARGAADDIHTAHGNLIRVLNEVHVPENQARTDVGAKVPYSVELVQRLFDGMLI